LLENQIKSKVFIIEQGFTRSISKVTKNEEFSLVYSSPYIDAKNDKHENHPTWGADKFIKEIIPKILEADSELEIHLVGRTGFAATEFLKQFTQVKLHGLKSFKENSEILQCSHVGLYPRTFDNRRRVQKIFEYIGANLPIVTFNLEDTSPVSEFGVGLTVYSADEFVEAAILLKNNHDLYEMLCSNVSKVQTNYSWQNLASRFDKLIYDSFQIGL
jgi:glycosyltransferase involved in cell wall biosynthesis